MTRNLLSLHGRTGPLAYVLLATPILFSQHAYVAWALWQARQPILLLDPWFWLFPIRKINLVEGLSTPVAVGSFLVCLLAGGLLTILSFRRANWAERGHMTALFAMIPTVQLAAVVIMAVILRRTAQTTNGTDPLPDPDVSNLRHIAMGLLSGMAIIVGAVVVSAQTFGAYGWGLFVMTPFLAGFTTAWFANRHQKISMAQTTGLVMASGALGCAALLMLALEGFACIVLILPLGAAIAFVGGSVGRIAAQLSHDPTGPFVSVAILPLIFMIEAAIPPQVAIEASEHIDIAASPEATWAALPANRPITAPPGLVGRAGLAYAIGSHLSGSGVGAARTGQFSTGASQERVTVWRPGRELALQVLTQPPAMEEMSPYRRVHAPHVEGYFLTETTRFTLRPLANGGTRLSISATHQLRIDPTPYWGPIARWAISENMQRVLGDIRREAEAR